MAPLTTSENIDGSASTQSIGKSPRTEAPLKSLKPKYGDLNNVEIITLDSMYDLTLVVGEEHASGVKAFRINSGSLRLISPVFQAMRKGNFAESTQSIIPLPEDSCNAFEVLLLVTHLMQQDLPSTLTKSELIDLAALIDKYQINDFVLTFFYTKWLRPHKGKGEYWPTTTVCQDWALATRRFKLAEDSDYLFNVLAMNLCFDENQHCEWYLDNDEYTLLSQTLPDDIIKTIREVRLSALEAILSTYKAAVETAIKQEGCRTRHSAACAATKVGILIKALTEQELYPFPADASSMDGTVCDYWEDLKNTLTKYKDYSPCSSGHGVRCSYDRCFGDFGIFQKFRETLKAHAHKGLWLQWENSGYTKF